MSFIVNYVKDTAAGYLKTGLEAGGNMAGNAVGGVGTMIENSGRGLGEGTVKGGISSVGNMINGYGASIQNSMAADGPVNRPGKLAVKATSAPKKGVMGPGQQAKALPGSGVKKPATPISKTSHANTSSNKMVGAAKSPAKSVKTTGGKTTISTASRPGGPGKPAPAKSSTVRSAGTPTTATNAGKVRISPASRPKSAIKA
ncbi:Hypothetical protein R9X50_00312300 [Acrodontium crateriforme]|uniref:Uncharacterized protein n=1 Tax=Acrodontium crateriforme TaxID=150365 RepID=A0AAQ3RBK8_9PEZI|nr:Hypothetical protein R9X50_00312300 [Acrodontium crateriforme]